MRADVEAPPAEAALRKRAPPARYPPERDARIDEQILALLRPPGKPRDSLADLRMLPAGTVLEPLARIVHDVALLGQRGVELSIEGSDVALDKVVLEAIKEPLIHLVQTRCAASVARGRLLAGKRSVER